MEAPTGIPAASSFWLDHYHGSVLYQLAYIIKIFISQELVPRCICIYTGSSFKK